MSAPVNGLIWVACSKGTHSHANSAAGTFGQRQPDLGDRGIGGAEINADDARARLGAGGGGAKFFE